MIENTFGTCQHMGVKVKFLISSSTSFTFHFLPDLFQLQRFDFHGKYSSLLKTPTHARTHPLTHARTHARTHAETTANGLLILLIARTGVRIHLLSRVRIYQFSNTSNSGMRLFSTATIYLRLFSTATIYLRLFSIATIYLRLFSTATIYMQLVDSALQHVCLDLSLTNRRCKRRHNCH